MEVRTSRHALPIPSITQPASRNNLHTSENHRNIVPSSTSALPHITPVRTISSQINYKQEQAVANYVSISTFEEGQSHRELFGIDLYA